MLLRLFAPGVHAAYLRSNLELPATVPIGSIVGLNVNFIHAGFNALGNRRLSSDPSENIQQWALLVADLLNYYLIGELLRTLRFFTGDGATVAQRVGARLETERLDAFGSVISARSLLVRRYPRREYIC